MSTLVRPGKVCAAPCCLVCQLQHPSVTRMDVVNNSSNIAMTLSACCSHVGLWPEFGLINHSCVPNISVSNVSERLLIRVAIGVVPVGAEITTSYLDVSAGGLPLQQRQELLQHSYSFTCKCPRCTVRMVSRLPLFGISQPVLSWVPVLRLYEIVRVFAHQQNATLMQSAIT